MRQETESMSIMIDLMRQETKSMSIMIGLMRQMIESIIIYVDLILGDGATHLMKNWALWLFYNQCQSYGLS